MEHQPPKEIKKKDVGAFSYKERGPITSPTTTPYHSRGWGQQQKRKRCAAPVYLYETPPLHSRHIDVFYPPHILIYCLELLVCRPCILCCWGCQKTRSTPPRYSSIFLGRVRHYTDRWGAIICSIYFIIIIDIYLYGQMMV